MSALWTICNKFCILFTSLISQELLHFPAASTLYPTSRVCAERSKRDLGVFRSTPQGQYTCEKKKHLLFELQQDNIYSFSAWHYQGHNRRVGLNTLSIFNANKTPWNIDENVTHRVMHLLCTCGHESWPGIPECSWSAVLCCVQLQNLIGVEVIKDAIKLN